MQEIQLLKDLAELKSKYTEGSSQNTIDGWMKRAKEALIIENLKEHKGIQIIIENCTAEIEMINDMLLNQVELPDRELLMYKRELSKQFLSMFTEATNTIKSITNQVNEQNGE